MFAIEMLPAAQGDCLLIEYGARKRPHRFVIDGGTAGTWPALRARLEALPVDQRHLELLVVTHVDADHIAGVLPLLDDRALGVSYGDVWFNGWKHLPGPALELGPVQGERLSASIEARRLPWNAAFAGAAVALPDVGPPLRSKLPGGLFATVIGPGLADLRRLRPVWESEVTAAGLAPGVAPTPPGAEPSDADLVLGGGPPNVESLAKRPFTPDNAPANGSSISLLLSYRGRTALVTGDAHAETLAAGLDRLLLRRPEPWLVVNAVKLAHHGSRYNTSLDLLNRLRSVNWLFSSNGAYFHHPDAEAVSRVLVAQPKGAALHFNYRSDETSVWDEENLKREFEYSARYPTGVGAGLRVEIG